MQEIGSETSNTNPRNENPISECFYKLIIKIEAVGLIVLCMASCVMNHGLNVLFCSFPALLIFISMITTALLNSYSESSYALLQFFVYKFVSVWCWRVAALCFAWMLRLLQFDCFSENVFSGITAESLSACIIMRRLILLLPDYWIFKVFLPFPGKPFCSVMNLCDFFWWADGILMNSTEDILMWCLSSCNPDINCQTGGLENSYNC